MDDFKKETVVDYTAFDLNCRKIVPHTKQRNKAEKKIKAQDLNFKLALKSLEDKVTKGLSTKVKIVGTKSKGKIEIEYYGTEDLERIVKLMNL